MAKYTEERLKSMGLSQNSIPKHVAIIMDGNGRWATSRGLPRTLGHRAGVNRLRGIIRLSSDIGIEALTLYAFSTENWKRPSDEVSTLCSLLIEYFNKEIDELDENDVCIRALGDIKQFPKPVYAAIDAAVRRTAQNKGLKLCIALNYGGYAEIARAAQILAVQYHDMPEKITPEQIKQHLYTAGLPDLDLLIRTGGEKRISNFLLFQVAYAELLFTDTYWPDYSDDAYLDSLRDYAGRMRRYGGLESKKG